MKIISLIRFLFLVLAATSIFSCGDKSEKKLRIGLAMDTYTEERWRKDADFFTAKVNALGATVEVQACNGNEQLQNQQIENFVTKGMDVIVVVPHNSKTCATAVKQARDAGIQVIAYDRMIKDCDINLYISFDNERVGQMQAEYALSKAPTGNYLLIQGSPTDENAFLYQKGQMKVLQPFIDNKSINIVLNQFCKDWQPLEALKFTQNALTANDNNITAIVVANDGLAGGCIQALAEQQLQGKVTVTGQDAELGAIQRIIDGTQSMTVYKPVKLLAEEAASIAVQFAQHKPLTNATTAMNNGLKDVPCVLLTPISVDKQNYESTVVKDGYIDKLKLRIQ